MVPSLALFAPIVSAALMENWKSIKGRQQKPRRALVFLLISAASITIIWMLFSSSISVSGLLLPPCSAKGKEGSRELERKYLYWGEMVDCPGKHCGSCEGLGHQEAGLRCALEEALFLKRVFVMPSRMCLRPIHNVKGILHSINASSQETWDTSSCAMDSLYDPNLISKTIPMILDNSTVWNHVLSTSTKLGNRGVAHIERASRNDLNSNVQYSNTLLMIRTISGSWYTGCWGRTNDSSLTLPDSFLPMSAAKKLRDAAEKIKELLGDYDAIHVRRGDKLNTEKDQFGVIRCLHPHLDRDTHPEFIRLRIAKWIPPGRTLFIASNERKPGFFSALSEWYKLAYSSNYSSILDPVIENNYQLFMVERLIFAGAKTFFKTFKDYKDDLSLTDDPKHNTQNWQIPVYTM